MLLCTHTYVQNRSGSRRVASSDTVTFLGSDNCRPTTEQISSSVIMLLPNGCGTLTQMLNFCNKNRIYKFMIKYKIMVLLNVYNAFYGTHSLGHG